MNDSLMVGCDHGGRFVNECKHTILPESYVFEMINSLSFSPLGLVMILEERLK